MTSKPFHSRLTPFTRTAGRNPAPAGRDRSHGSAARLLWSERYDPEGDEDTPRPDQGQIERMVDQYTVSGEAPAGYALDAGVLGDGRTALVEINDGYALGFYGRLTPERAQAYLSLLTARFRNVLGRTCR